MVNLEDWELKPVFAHSGTQDREVGGAPQPVSDNLDDLSNEGERQITVITRLKELISNVIAVVQEEVFDTEQQTVDTAQSVWTRLGGNQQELKRLRYWRKALKRLEKLGEDLIIYATKLKSDWATSKAKVDDLHDRIKVIYVENGIPFQAKWRSLRAAVFRMWVHGNEGGGGVQDIPDAGIPGH